MNREQENRLNIAEQGVPQSGPEDAKTKFHRMVQEARTPKPSKSKAESYIAESPGSPATSRDLSRDAKMFREQSQEEHRLPEQRQSMAQAAEHFQQVADKNQEMVNLRLSQLSPDEQKSWTEEHDRLNRTIDAMETAIFQHQGSAQERIKESDKINEFKEKRKEWEAKLPSLKSMAP